MTSQDRVITAVAEANPVDPAAPPSAQDRAEADAIRRRVLSAPTRSRPRAVTLVLVPALSTVVVLAVIWLFLGVGGPKRRDATASHGTERTIILQALPTVQTPLITAAAMARELQIVRERLGSLAGSSHATLAGADRIRVTVGRDVSPAETGRIVPLLTGSARLYFYDWEANVLTPNGQTVASQLPTQNASALQVSQGGSATGPGDSGSGSMSLYDAVKLASQQPMAPASPGLSRLGPQYYMFGKPGSAACASAAADSQTTLVPGRYCLLSGPDYETSTTSSGHAVADLDAGLPAGVTPAQAAAQGRVLAVPQGTVVIQAANPSAARQVRFSDGSAQFYVLRDNVALTGNDIVNPTAGTDQSGAPDVQFGFTHAGAARFQSVTAQIARRGDDVSSTGQTLNQHFAVALGGIQSQLVLVASIDFKQYPDGIPQSAGHTGADIGSPMTATSAKDLATQLRDGALPLNLRVAR